VAVVVVDLLEEVDVAQQERGLVAVAGGVLFIVVVVGALRAPPRTAGSGEERTS
jgi:hypothetical protein